MGWVRKFFGGVYAVAICGSLAVAVGLVVPAGAAFPGASGKIAFTRSGGGADSEIYTMDPDGTDMVNLTDDAVAEEGASWSPDGSKIAFTKDAGAPGNQVWLMDADGSSPANLTTHSQSHAAAHCGDKVAFTSNQSGGYHIWVINADGTSPTQLTFGGGTNSQADWRYDCAKIAFMSNRDGDQEIFVMNANGSAQTQLTFNTVHDSNPNWSPDGSMITFDSVRDADAGGTYEVYAMNADGSAPTRLTTSDGDNNDPAWSPDCRSIAFASARDGDTEIYTMNPDGSGQTNVTDSPATNEGAPNWQPIAAFSATCAVAVGGPYEGVEGSEISLDGNVATTRTTEWTYAAVSGVDAGATCSFTDAAAEDTSVTCTDDGTYSVTLTAQEGINSPVGASAELVVTNQSDEEDPPSSAVPVVLAPRFTG
jgi:TolB protein